MSASNLSKRGLMVPWNFSPEDFNLYFPTSASSTSKISWVANWEMWKPQGLEPHLASNAVHYIPQCRTAKEANQISEYLSGYHRDGNLHAFMGFNEPDIESQANLSVDEAVKLWKEFVLPVKQQCPGFKVGSPAVSNGPRGLPWLKEFVDRLGGLEAGGIDFIVIHYYSPDVEDFKRYVLAASETFGGRPLWITEFSCTTWDPQRQASESEVISFMKEALPWLDKHPSVERYAWFGAMREVGDEVGRANGLQRGGEALSEAGKVYMML